MKKAKRIQKRRTHNNELYTLLPAGAVYLAGF